MATYCFRRRRRRYWDVQRQLRPQAQHARVRVFSVAQIHKATNNLSQECLSGGGFGSMYKAHFSDGVTGAVKVEDPSSNFTLHTLIKRPHCYSKSITKVYLVNLIGLCTDKSFIPAMLAWSLSHGWLSRMKIVYQAASALEYLHHATSPPIVHRDIKSANILLTFTNTAKLADFGLSKAAPADASQFQSVHTVVKGSFGYMDPQYMRARIFSSKSDVYSYGVVVLEHITGHSAILDGNLLAERALEYLQDSSIVHDMLDLHLLGKWNSADLVILVGLVKMCLQDDAQSRPTMQQEVSLLTERGYYIRGLPLMMDVPSLP